MTDTPFTPGPWVFDCGGGTEEKFPQLACGASWGNIRDGNGHIVAQVRVIDSEEVRSEYRHEKLWGKTPPKTLAITRLVAKSRELLEALEEMVNMECAGCEIGNEFGFSEELCSKHGCIAFEPKCLIAEAKGETK